jgi:tetratricopeptide (TPR) repeat protein
MRRSNPVKDLVVVLSAAWFICSGRTLLAGGAPEVDRAFVIGHLRNASRLLPTERDQKLHALARIGIAQVQLKDLQGALKTLQTVPPIERRIMYDFVAQLGSLEASMGDPENAVTTVESVAWQSWHFEHCEALLAAARAAAKTGRKAATERAIVRSIEIAMRMEDDHHHMPDILCKIGTTQIAVGASAEAKKTRRLLESLTDRLKEDDQARARSLRHLGLLCARLSEHQAAKVHFANALRAINPRVATAGSAYRWIAEAQAEFGDIEAALTTARSIGTPFHRYEDRDAALQSIAMLQLSINNRAGAEHTVKQIPQFFQYHSEALTALVESYARAGEANKAIAMANSIIEDSRKAQAMLQIATILAQRGDKKVARKIAEGLTYPRFRDGLLRRLGHNQQFNFRDHKTWGELYESTGEFTIASSRGNQATAGDLTAAAMQCRIALDGRGGIAYGKVLEYWDVRKVAKVQAAAGDASGALDWLEGLSASQRLEALLGLADGLASFLEQRDRIGKKSK